MMIDGLTFRAIRQQDMAGMHWQKKGIKPVS